MIIYHQYFSDAGFILVSVFRQRCVVIVSKHDDGRKERFFGDQPLVLARVPLLLSHCLFSCMLVRTNPRCCCLHTVVPPKADCGGAKILMRVTSCVLCVCAATVLTTRSILMLLLRRVTAGGSSGAGQLVQDHAQHAPPEKLRLLQRQGKGQGSRWMEFKVPRSPSKTRLAATQNCSRILVRVCT